MIIYIVLVTGLRLLGKRQVGEVSLSELAATILVSELAAIPMQDFGAPLIGGIVPIIVLLSMEVIMSVLSQKFTGFRTLLSGKPSIVISNGVLNQREIRRTRLSLDELLEELRLKGVFDISTVRYAIIETNGQLSIILSPEDRPATAGLMGYRPAEASRYLPVILDGRLITDNLKKLCLDERWVRANMDRHGVTHERRVFLMMADDMGGSHIVMKEQV